MVSVYFALENRLIGAGSNLDRKQLDLSEECRQLMGGSRTLILATTSEDGMPDASVVPYLMSGGGFVIFVSELAKHTANLLRKGSLGKVRCSVLFLEDERQATNVFARKRLVIACDVWKLERSELDSGRLLEGMEAKFGPVVGMLRQLPDFHLLRLEPVSCNYVRGFGQAFSFGPQDHPGMWLDSTVAGLGL